MSNLKQLRNCSDSAWAASVTLANPSMHRQKPNRQSDVPRFENISLDTVLATESYVSVVLNMPSESM